MVQFTAQGYEFGVVRKTLTPVKGTSSQSSCSTEIERNDVWRNDLCCDLFSISKNHDALF